MKKIVLAALFLLLASVLPAAAQGPYVGLAGGLAFFHDSDVDSSTVGYEEEWDWGGGFNVSGGMNFDMLRLEVEFGMTTAESDDTAADYTVMSYMLNGYYDFKLANAPVSPFLGAGLGFLDAEIDNLEGVGDVDDTVFGYQFTAGVTSHLTNYLDLDIFYRFQNGFDDFEENGAEVEYGNCLLFAGLRYHFR